VTPDAIGSVVLALVVGVIGYFAGYSSGEYRGECNEREAAIKERDALVANWRRRAGALVVKLTRQNTAVLQLRVDLAAKQRRVRGVLTEARRWKAIAASLGWKRETRGEMHARWEREAKESK
jgi:hypothetical protein